MELVGELQIHIKQEPLEEFGCEQFGQKCTEQLSSSSDPISEISTRPEVERGVKRKDLEGNTESLTEKRKRFNLPEANDVEIFAEDYRTAKATTTQDRQRDRSPPILAKLSKFSCLLCDDEFDKENELMFHLSLVHKHVPDNRSRQSGRFSRHTCQICFARFRTLKDFFNHTSCHNTQPSVNPLDRDLSARVVNSLSKNALQNYFLNAASSFGSSDMMQPTFKCDCCSTVFVNRDSYAMHVMMRVKNESCKIINGVDSSAMDEHLLQSTAATTNGEHCKSPGSTPNVLSADVGRTKADERSPPALHQAYYIDVTSSAEKDEYLQSVLVKNNANTSPTDTPFGIDSIRAAIKEGRKCVACDELFDDQDSLAMHVMARHSDNMTSSSQPPPLATVAKYSKAPSSPIPSRIINYFSPFAHDRLLTLQTEVLYCDQCGQSFMNRDALAMHVITHIRDHETLVSSSSSSVTSAADSMRIHSRVHASYKNERYRRQHEKSMGLPLAINTDEPLDLAAKKTFSSNSTSSEKENRGPTGTDLNVSIDLRMSREDAQADAPEQETDSTFTEPPLLKSMINGNDEYDVSSGADEQPTEIIYESLDTVQEPVWTRSASAPSINFQELPGPSERAASTGCLPSASQLETIPNGFIFAPQELYSNTQIDMSMSYEKPKSDNKEFRTPVESVNRELIHETSTGNMLHSSDSLEGLLGFKKPEVRTPTSTPQLVGCPYMAADGKEPNIMATLMKNKDLHMCKYCEIIFPTRTLYYLHMGLHNVNTPWQCNMCGKVCGNVHDFNAHIIHL